MHSARSGLKFRHQFPVAGLRALLVCEITCKFQVALFVDFGAFLDDVDRSFAAKFISERPHFRRKFNIVRGDIYRVWGRALAPGYGRIGLKSFDVIKLITSQEGLFRDPVYTAKSFYDMPSLFENGHIPKGAKVCFVDIWGLAALFAYEDQLAKLLGIQAP